MRRPKHRLIPACLFFMSLVLSNITTADLVDWSHPDLTPLSTFFSQETRPTSAWPTLHYLDKSELPAPYYFLLTQPLMTQGITEYYQRSPKVRLPLYVTNNPKQRTYSRAVIMVVDNHKQRDDALVADQMAETTIVELGLITMNFATLTQAVIDGVLHTQIPFGALLANNQVKIHSVNRRYFSIRCDRLLAHHLHCAPNQTLYGRTNTLLRADNQQWLAQVVEVLTDPTSFQFDRLRE